VGEQSRIAPGDAGKELLCPFLASAQPLVLPTGPAHQVISVAGAVIGARMTLKHGSKFVRVVLLIVVICTALRLAADQLGLKIG
jgi:uncharacterized membrane protein YfcA